MYIKIGIVLFSLISLSISQECSEVGFFRNEDDCTAFHRCVDFYNIGRFTKFDFVCPEGLVFDETLSVCNWPWSSAPCENTEEEATTDGEEVVPEEVEPEEVVPEEEETTTPSEEDVEIVGEEIDESESEEETEEDASGEEEDNNLIIIPSFDYQCTDEGLYPHESNCAKFWLCKESGGNLDPAELYRCPDGFLFDESIFRCQKEEGVECEKVPDAVQQRLESPATVLQVSELESFFRKWSF